MISGQLNMDRDQTLISLYLAIVCCAVDWVVQYRLSESILPSRECTQEEELDISLEIIVNQTTWNPRIVKGVKCRCLNRYYLRGWMLEGQDEPYWKYDYICDRVRTVYSTWMFLWIKIVLLGSKYIDTQEFLAVLLCSLTECLNKYPTLIMHPSSLLFWVTVS